LLYQKISQEFKKELDDTLILNQSYESMLKIKNQQIHLLSIIQSNSVNSEETKNESVKGNKLF